MKKSTTIVWGDLAECQAETCYIVSIKQANKKISYDWARAMKQCRLPWLTTCKWTIYAQAHEYEKTWGRPTERGRPKRAARS